MAILAGCGVDQLAGADEPLRIHAGTFILGPLPGEPTAEDGTEAPAEVPGPRITAIESATPLIRHGHANRSIGGRATEDAYSVGVRFQDLGSGYWVDRVGGVDAALPGERVFDMTADFGYDIPPGRHNLLFTAFDQSGSAGPQRAFEVCVLPAIPDNLNVCRATLKPPEVVVSLEWDSDMDVDLEIETPDGKRVSAKRPTTALGETTGVPDAALNDPSTGKMGADSNGRCRIDGIRQEYIVWQGAPKAGLYLFFANVFEACGAPSTHFRLAIHRAVPSDVEGEWRVETTYLRQGPLVAAQANGGAKTPLYVTSLTFPLPEAGLRH